MNILNTWRYEAYRILIFHSIQQIIKTGRKKIIIDKLFIYMNGENLRKIQNNSKQLLLWEFRVQMGKAKYFYFSHEFGEIFAY